MSDVILSPAEQQYLMIMEDLNKPRGDGIGVGLKTRLHAGQITALSEIYIKGKSLLFQPTARKFGKSLCLNTKVLTPKGWIANKDLEVGNEVYDHKGDITSIIGFSPIYRDHDCYNVKFQDGTSIIADAEHNWLVGSVRGKYKVIQTKDINLVQWYRTPLPVKTDGVDDFLLDPYILGAWLGDGTSLQGSITTVDDEIYNSFKAKYEPGNTHKITYYFKGLRQDLKPLNLIGNKHIPRCYMNATLESRLELVKGLMDTDGSVDKRGVCEFSQKNEILFNQVVELVRSCGVRVHVGKPKLIDGTEYHRFFTSSNKQVFKLKRKADRLHPFLNNIRRQSKNIVSISKLDNPVPVRCLSVDSEEHTFIIDNYTTTHNTEESMYFLYRHAMLNPGSACYYVTDSNTHGRKLIWDNYRLQRFLYDKTDTYTSKCNELHMKVMFRNRSFIQIIGSENFGIANGLTPGIAVYDEFKLFHPRWHIDFAPNLIAKAAPLLIIGTMPTIGDRNYDQYYEVMDACKTDDRASIIINTTFDNPVITKDRARLKATMDEIASLRARGEEDVVQREYYSKIIPGGKRAVFPMLQETKHVHPHHELMDEIRKDRGKMEWCWIADPGNTTVFGMLFGCYNPYTGAVYILDEIYEKDQYNTSTGKIVPKALDIIQSLYPDSQSEDDWTKACDDQAAWFMTEAMDRFNIYFAPAEKWRGTKEEGLSIIKDQLIHNIIKISDRCSNLFTEMQTYAKDSSGKIPKKHDHLIDSLRYFNLAINYDFQLIDETVKARHGIREPDDEDKWDENIGEDFDFNF